MFAAMSGMAHPHRVHVDPDTGIPDLVHRLTDDAKRLAADEARLAKLEVHDAVHRAGRGAIAIGIAFGLGIVALVALTLLVATLIGRLAAGHMWIGAFVTGLGELAVALHLMQRGKQSFAEPSYTLAQTRETARWVLRA